MIIMYLGLDVFGIHLITGLALPCPALRMPYSEKV